MFGSINCNRNGADDQISRNAVEDEIGGRHVCHEAGLELDARRHVGVSEALGDLAP